LWPISIYLWQNGWNGWICTCADYLIRLRLVYKSILLMLTSSLIDYC
jgi:hypothetical protein